MRRLLGLIIVAGLGVGGWYVFETHEIHLTPRVTPAGGAPGGLWAAASGEETPPPAGSGRETIRMATVNLGRFDENKLANPRARDVLVQLLGRFDLVAVQGLYGANQGVLVHLLELVNAGGRTYDFAVSPTLGLHGPEIYSAFVFERASIEIDRSVLYQIEDNAGRLHQCPLVGSFRARGPDPAEAFTFTVVNVQIAADDPLETAMLEQVYRTARQRRPGEDDVLLVGTTMCSAEELSRLEKLFGLGESISNTPTTTRGTQLADNIFFNRRATTEFTGRAGVVDLLREFSLTYSEALEISDHLPVWAEFSVFEGGQAGQAMSLGSRGLR